MDWGGCPVKFWIWGGTDLDPASWGGLELVLKIWPVKTSSDQWNLPYILAYISGIFNDFFKGELVPLRVLAGAFYEIFTKTSQIWAYPAPFS